MQFSPSFETSASCGKREVRRPCDVPEEGLVCDLLWSDPEPDITGWAENDRGVSYVFGPDIVTDFLDKNDFDLVVRAHQVVEDGYEFFASRQMVAESGRQAERSCVR